ncbi:hypothetical protein PR048_033467 [Dryococelus australis]|uniref:Uncharacterized protein n=1 Tax=Dryococelus australis TaxID=614101 RepID=A0ABQ9G0C9_9NEOP|nr:hypothetical protein PR048_033467 [Dryococelus australis]
MVPYSLFEHIREDKYELLHADKQSKWFCKFCNAHRDGQNKGDEKVARQSILNRLTSLVEEIWKLRHENKELKNSIIFTQAQMDAKQNDFENVLTEVRNLRHDVDELKHENKDLKQYSKINNLELRGISYTKDENPTNIVTILQQEYITKPTSQVLQQGLEEQLAQHKYQAHNLVCRNWGRRTFQVNILLTQQNRFLLMEAKDLKQLGF